MAAAGYALLVAGLTLIFGNSIIVNNTYITGIIIFLLALALVPLRSFLQRSIDMLFSRSQAAYRLRLQAFGRELTRAMDLAAIINLLRSYVIENLNPVHLHVFTHDPLTDHYLAAADSTAPGAKPTSDLRFSLNSALVSTLVSQHSSIYLGEAHTLPASLQPEQARIALLNSQLFVPLPGRQALAGWLAMGVRYSGEAYNTRDLEFLESLCDQAALAIERAQVVADLERRVHAMNVLTRVSQGINVTLAFDDILELIYAQTNRVVPTVIFASVSTIVSAIFSITYFSSKMMSAWPSRKNSPFRSDKGWKGKCCATVVHWSPMTMSGNAARAVHCQKRKDFSPGAACRSIRAPRPLVFSPSPAVIRL